MTIFILRKTLTVAKTIHMLTLAILEFDSVSTFFQMPPFFWKRQYVVNKNEILVILSNQVQWNAFSKHVNSMIKYQISDDERTITIHFLSVWYLRTELSCIPHTGWQKNYCIATLQCSNWALQLYWVPSQYEGNEKKLIEQTTLDLRNK